MVSTKQLIICLRHGVLPAFPHSGSMIGVAKNFTSGLQPLNGLRHPVQGVSNGWYLWAGEELSQADDFFAPQHVEHLYEDNSPVLEFLALPPGWRFLIAPGQVDVWYDDSLFNI